MTALQGTAASASTAAGPVSIGAKASKYTVLITVFEGRNFLRKPLSKLYVQCRFNEEILTTDPVDHSTTPIWDTELAWDLDSKVLHFLRSQRVSLKLVVYGIDQLNRRENFGFVMLDLRAAADIPAQDRWYPLVNTKTVGTAAFRPEIKLSFGVAGRQTLNYNPSVPAPVVGGLVGANNNNINNNHQGSNSSPAKKKQQPSSKSSPSRHTTTTSNNNMSMNAGHGLLAHLINDKNNVGISSELPLLSIPVQLTDNGYFQIGNPIQDEANGARIDDWILSFTIAFAENLHLLVEDGQSKLATMTNGFYFYFSFLGNDVITDKFFDLARPDFAAGRISIRLRTSPENLKIFLEEVTKTIIYVCHDTSVLGYVDVALTPLLSEDVLEKVYNVYNTRQELPQSSQGECPTVGIAIGLVKEESEFDTRPVSPLANKTMNVMQSVNDESGFGLRNRVSRGASVVRSRSPSPTGAGVVPRSIASPSQMNGNSNGNAIGLNHFLQSSQFAGIGTHNNINNGLQQSTTSIVPPRWHQFRFSIDLRSVRDFTTNTSIFCRYTYTPFGTSSPISTHPPIPVTKSGITPPSHESEHLLPHSFCAFEFVMAPETLETYLDAVPLLVEIWSRDTYEKDFLMGVASVDMGRVWRAKSSREEFESVVNSGKKGNGNGGSSLSVAATLRSFDTWCVVEDRREGKRFKKLGELRVILALEDFGNLEEAEAEGQPGGKIVSSSSSVEDLRAYGAYEFVQPGMGVKSTFPIPKVSVGPALGDVKREEMKQVGTVSVSAATNTDNVNTATKETATTTTANTTKPIQETDEYKLAMELEIWKQSEEAAFKAHLARRETDLMAQLSQEWKRREHERELSLKKKMTHIRALEETATKMIEDLETRERTLSRAEDEQHKRQEELEREYFLKMESTRDAARRLHEEYLHKLSVEKSRVEELETRVSKYSVERDGWEAKCRSVEGEYEAYRKNFQSSSEGSLRAEVSTLISEKVQLEKKLDLALRSKKYYKEELTKAMNDLEKLKLQFKRDLEEAVLKERKEINNLKSKFSAREELGVVEDDRKALEEIKKELEALKMGNYEVRSKMMASNDSLASLLREGEGNGVDGVDEETQTRGEGETGAGESRKGKEKEEYHEMAQKQNTESSNVSKFASIASPSFSVPSPAPSSSISFSTMLANHSHLVASGLPTSISIDSHLTTGSANNNGNATNKLGLVALGSSPMFSNLSSAPPINFSRPPLVPQQNANTNTTAAQPSSQPSSAPLTAQSSPRLSSAYRWSELNISVSKLLDLPPLVLSEAERLMRERDGLLETGIYTREDRLIRDLEKRVLELVHEGV